MPSNLRQWTWTASGFAVLAGIITIVLVLNGPNNDWQGKNSFCEAAEALQVGEETLTNTEQADIMKTLISNASDDVRPDLEELLHRLQDHPDMLTPNDPLVTSTGEFIETNCSLNLPGVQQP